MDSDPIPRNLAEKEVHPSSVLDQASLVSIAYTSFINKVVNKNTDTPTLDGIEDKTKTKLEQVFSSTARHTTEQGERFKAEGWTGYKLFQQIAENEATRKFIEENKEKIELLIPSEGIFVVLLESSLYEKLLRHNVAFFSAFEKKYPEQLSFIVTDKQVYEGLSLLRQKSGLAHEVSHLVWGFAKNDSVVATSETDQTQQTLFLTFQDELIARVTGNSRPMGYAKPPRSEIGVNPIDGIVRVINGKFNNMLEDIGELLLKNGLPPSTVLKLAIDATNFQELEDGIKLLGKALRI